MAPAFAASADFAIDKPAGSPCPNLRADFGCGAHSVLRQTGFTGCTVYDCFGAGQQVAQVSFGGTDWRAAPDTAPQMFAVFGVMRQLHELLWLMGEALGMPSTSPVHPQLRESIEQTARITYEPPEVVAAFGIEQHREATNTLLRQASELARRGIPHRREDLRGADLVGATLGRADLQGANLRGANLSRSDLSTTCFLSQAQLQAAFGDHRTLLPDGRTHPAHWPAAPE